MVKGASRTGGHEEGTRRSLIRPVILSGGMGSRLWPWSRRHCPKQFLDIMQGESLFEATLRRVENRSLYASPIIVCHADHQFLVLNMLSRLGIKDATVLLEPEGRNTAAAMMVAMQWEIHRADPPMDVHLVMPCDHRIEDDAAFHATIATAAEAAGKEKLVVLGIEATHPETGYGYILGEPHALDGMPQVKPIARFVEKPAIAQARRLMRQGALWNSGMFLYAPPLLVAEAQQWAPDYLRHTYAALQNAEERYGATLLEKRAYDAIAAAPFDTLIMERTANGAMLPCRFGWSDLGSWQALWQCFDKDEAQNVTLGNVAAYDTRGSYVQSQGPALAVIGMQDCVAVATKDAVLVAPRHRAQEVRELLMRKDAVADASVTRPWGRYEVLNEGRNFKVKRLVVKPGGKLSLQLHRHRAEHWVVISGVARVECEGEEQMVHPNQSIGVPKGKRHRLSNPGSTDLQLIEVQSGDYIGEDDITRFDDIYGRISPAC